MAGILERRKQRLDAAMKQADEDLPKRREPTIPERPRPRGLTDMGLSPAEERAIRRRSGSNY